MRKGFTLIELLVVIAIIALLSTLSVVALNNARVKSRDARRLSDIKQIRTALEMYFNQNNSYPIDGGNLGHGYD
ncbi:MAG TPA: prepilin-type N-terminal cleavage/methylation domain-containing protein, partial [bacterium]|nr:prepilin-type N-terminal cleavage/methylation domain-containing protein [bacterium]